MEIAHNPAGVVRIMLPDAEIDESIRDSGALSLGQAPSEGMRLIAADLIVAISSAIAMEDDAEFGRAIRELHPPEDDCLRDFAGRYYVHLVDSVRTMAAAPMMGLDEVRQRLHLVRALTTGTGATVDEIPSIQ